MQRVENLENVKIGDSFVVYKKYSNDKTTATCTYITPKQAFIGGYKYWKKDARGIGGGNWHSPPTLFIATQEAFDEIKLKVSFETARAWVYENLNKIPMEAFIEFYKQQTKEGK